MNKLNPTTKGVHHVGLAVSKLEESAEFFVKLLGWSEVRRDANYPAIFLTDGVLMVTLWGIKIDSPRKFDRSENIGLHHLALLVENFEVLNSVYKTLKTNDIEIEFSPELLRDGPAKHMMCYEPSGIRIEFICIPE